MDKEQEGNRQVKALRMVWDNRQEIMQVIENYKRNSEETSCGLNRYKPGTRITIFCPRHLSFHRRGTVESITAEDGDAEKKYMVTIEEGVKSL